MPKPIFHSQMASGLALGLGISLSLLATFFVDRWETFNQQLRFQRQIENLGTALQRNLNRYTDVLAFLGDYYQVAQPPVTQTAFAGFVARSLQTYSGIQALEWAPLVRNRDRLLYEQMIQSQGNANFQITELGANSQLIRASDRDYYVPVTYVEPVTENESALGYDLYSDPTRAIAIEQARDTGEITATGRIRLVQEKRDQFGFLVFLPLYQNSRSPTTLAQRRQSLNGFILGVFRVSDVVEEALQDLQYEIDFTLYDQSDPSTEQFLGRYQAEQKQVTTVETPVSPHAKSSFLCSPTLQCTKVLTVGQRQWSIIFSPGKNYPIEPRYGTLMTLAGGLLLTLGLVIFLYRLNRELTQTRILNDLKFRFFSMASHELRTPLSIIALSSESLQLNYHQLSEEQKQLNLQRICLTAKRMSQQLTDLLMLTRAEVGKLEFQPELCNIELFCLQLIEEIQGGIYQKIELICPQPIRAFLDKKLLRSLLTNLLLNAAKYSPEQSSIQLIVRHTEPTVTFEIIDQGIGIPVADQPYIQDTFYRGSNVGEISGTGLGLAIVKTCVDLHHGNWKIDSQETQGTTVTVQLPLE